MLETSNNIYHSQVTQPRIVFQKLRQLSDYPIILMSGSSIRTARTVATMTPSLDKFKGCLVGAVIGDCLGAPVECQWWGGIPSERVEKRFEDYFNHGSNNRLFKYTDDTAMARLVT